MKIKENGMFASPESFKVIEDWIEAHPSTDRAHLYTAAMMAWNLAAKLTSEEELNQ